MNLTIVLAILQAIFAIGLFVCALRSHKFTKQLIDRNYELHVQIIQKDALLARYSSALDIMKSEKAEVQQELNLLERDIRRYLADSDRDGYARKMFEKYHSANTEIN